MDDILDGFVIILIVLSFLVGLLFFVDKTPPVPSAIDVYRGKTILEITYKDGVAIDSIVVFKDKYLKH